MLARLLLMFPGTPPSSTDTAKNQSVNTASTPVDTSKPVAVEEERWYSPVVIQLAREAKIPKEELDAIQGTGYEGRLSKKDIKDYIEKKKRGDMAEQKPASAVAAPATSKPSVAVSSETEPTSTQSAALHPNRLLLLPCLELK